MQGRQPRELRNGALLDEAGREQRAAHTQQATAAEEILVYRGLAEGIVSVGCSFVSTLSTARL